MSLLPPNARGTERTFEAVVERAATIDVPLDRMWSPQTCPAPMLPWLAWALSVDVWNPDWPESIQRQVIEAAVGVHRKKGTIGAVKDAVAAIGVAARITEWFEQDPPASPYTFAVEGLVNGTVIAGVTLDAQTQRDLLDFIAAAKNVRSHFSLVLAADFGSGLGLASALGGAGRVRIRTTAPGRHGLAAGLAFGSAQAPATHISAHTEVA